MEESGPQLETQGRRFLVCISVNCTWSASHITNPPRPGRSSLALHSLHDEKKRVYLPRPNNTTGLPFFFGLPIPFKPPQLAFPKALEFILTSVGVPANTDAGLPLPAHRDERTQRETGTGSVRGRRLQHLTITE